MTSQLLTSHGELDRAVDRLLELTRSSLDVFDRDLVSLALDRPARIEALQRVLAERAHRIRIVVQDGARVQTGFPRLMRLLETHSHHFSLIQAADSVLELADTLLIADGKHALVRFHRDQPRGRLIEDDAGEVRAYVTRLANILEEGGYPLATRIAGL